MQKFNILMAQINPLVGDIAANTEKMITIINQYQDSHDLIVFPELALSGYPPEDLLFRVDFHRQNEAALKKIAEVVRDCHVILGHPQQQQGQCFNAASVLFKGQPVAVYYKQKLPNYGVFDEQRYFSPGPAASCVLSIGEYRVAVCICEDLWYPEPVELILQTDAQLLIALNASPFDYNKYARREALLKKQAKKGLAIIYVNQIGGQDELVFDGQSMALDAQAVLSARAPAFVEALETVSFKMGQLSGTVSPLLSSTALLYNALVCGLRDYVLKNNFPGVLLGLSGGIDSALTLAIAVDALGAGKVLALLLPSRYTAEISNQDALQQLQNLQVSHHNVSIEPVFESFLQTLSPLFAQLPVDQTEENLQARIRGVLLMALSNKTGKMLLTTSNKSETAVGYSTLYGDMAGGFAVLKDVLKTQVYELARYVNRKQEIIPQRVLTRPPSAELAENQRDQDSLPDYALLDEIIQAFMEMNLGEKELIDRGYPEDVVKQVLHLIKRNEYKRRQAAPGVKISPRAFGKDWRCPITCG